MLPSNTHADPTAAATVASMVVRSGDRAAAACGLLQQVCSGYAVLLPFVLLRFSSLNPALVPVHAAMFSASVLIGCGAGYLLSTWVTRAFGLHVAARIGLLSTAAGISVVAAGPLPWATLPGCLLIGCGLFGEWTPSAELTRRSLTSTQLWRGMGIHRVLFFAGALLAAVLAGPSADAVFLTISLLIAGTCCLVAALVRPLPEDPVRQDFEKQPPSSSSQAGEEESADRVRGNRHSQLEPAFPLRTSSPFAGEEEQQPPVPATGHSGHQVFPEQECSVSEPELCEEEDCCGGMREWVPMPEWLGCCLALTGMYAVGMILPGLISGSHQLHAAVPIVGGLLGTVIFQSVLPAAGYAVLLVPGFLAGIIVFAASIWLLPVWTAVVLAAEGATAAAIWTGCSGLIGESFADSCHHRSRVLVLMFGSLGAAAVGLSVGIFAVLVTPAAVPVANALVCFMALIALRSIPSVLVSQRREDQVSPEEADRLLSETYSVAGGSVAGGSVE